MPIDDMINALKGKVCVNKLDIHAVVCESITNSRVTFDLENQARQFKESIGEMPTENVVFKILSGKQGFSSISVIDFVAKNEGIKELYCSTFRIGKKQFEILKSHKDGGRIENALFITSKTQENTDGNRQEYNYFAEIREKCCEMGWDIYAINNHSKIILMRTRKNYYVVETSSNLNENPQLEQFSIENSKKVFDFYKSMFEEMKKWAEQESRLANKKAT